MDNPKFKKLFNLLNKEQRLAVDSIEGPVMVIAGPGTGKTQTLTLRIANILLKTQINPENILALTFTESGVAEMRKRLSDIIGTPAYRVAIHTFHGFCHRLIQENPEDFKELMSARNITELEQIEIIEEVLTNLDLKEIKPFVDPLFYARAALTSINDLKKDGISTTEFKKAVEAQKKDFEKTDDLHFEKGKYKGRMKGKYQRLKKKIDKNSELVKVYEKYEKELRKRKLFDFSDMLLFVIRKMQSDEEFLLRVQEQYHYFLVDEHQDTNAAQNKVVELLASFFENPNLFVVGDEKQAIFRFQGASLENFLYFRKLYPNALLINLKKNYRSNQTLLDAAASLIEANRQIEILSEVEIQLEAASNIPNEKIKIAEVNEIDSEYHLVAHDIQKKIKDGVDPSEIAILVRKNRTLLPFANIFENKKIPHVLESEQNVIEDKNIRKFLLLLKCVTDIGNDELLIHAMHLDFLEIMPLDIYKIRKLSLDKKMSMWELLEQGLHKKLKLKSEDKIDTFINKCETWKKLVENEPVDITYIEILNDSDLLTSILSMSNGLDILEKFSRLYEEVKQQIIKNPLFSTEDFLQHIDLIEKHHISIRKSQAVKKEGVRLMTAHRAKGREFNHVYIFSATDKNWGNAVGRRKLFSLPWDYMTRLDNTPLDGDEVEDERRLFFVALTRARREAMISYSLADEEGKETIPSRFVSEISENFRQTKNISTFEKEFQNNKQVIFTPRPKKSGKEIEKEYTESKDFFARLFSHRGLSVSALNNYLDCPWRYFFRNLLTLPEVKSKHQKFGTSIHRAINRYIIATKRDNNLKKENLLEMYREALNDEALSDKDMEELKKRGEDVLSVYYDNAIINWPRNIDSEKQITGVKLKDGIILNGKLDMIEHLDENSARVYDFKTGKPKSRNHIEGKIKNSNGNYKRQLVFYKILLDRFQDGKATMKEGVIDFVEPNQSGKYKKEVFNISDEEVKDLEEVIIKVADEINNLEFWNRRCDNKDCEYCSLRDFIGA